MKAVKACVSIVAMVVLVFSALSVNVAAGENGNQKDKPDVMGFELNQNIAFGEVVGAAGIYVTGELFDLGPFVNETTGNELMAYGEPVNVLANWSDDIVLHQFKAGAKVRTEVILWDYVHEASVYTIRAEFKIEEIDPVSKAVIRSVWDGTVAEGLWADGPTDAYSAEVNQLGCLLFGYNWDTRLLDCGEGTYRLTFSIGSAMPDNVPYEGAVSQGITITGVDDVSTDVTDVYSDSSSTWIEMTLLPMGGRS
jgi:hypothetical protein